MPDGDGVAVMVDEPALAQMTGELTLTVGVAFTTTDALAVALKPFPSVTVTV